jgi:Papain fold toxin 1, glutamine deamidase
MADMAQRLRELGPGSSAVVGFDRENAPGHWFNGVNHAGTILAADGQAARFEEWPPSKDGLGFDENVMSYSDALYFTPDGKVVRNDHQ